MREHVDPAAQVALHPSSPVHAKAQLLPGSQTQSCVAEHVSGRGGEGSKPASTDARGTASNAHVVAVAPEPAVHDPANESTLIPLLSTIGVASHVHGVPGSPAERGPASNWEPVNVIFWSLRVPV
jgi:hypothetical protein